MRRNLWKKVTSATLCAAMVGGIMVSNGALAVQAEEGEEKEATFLHGQPVILVAGLGNQSVTPDSLGPRTVNNLSVSQNETGLKAIAPGVMAQTGMETARILSGLIREIKPDLVIAIDALAARSIRRLGTTIQLTDTGIHPGSGVGNHCIQR